MAGKISEQATVFTNLATATKVAAAQGTTSGVVQLGTAARNNTTDFPTKAEGAAGVPIADAGNLITATTVEGALQELAAAIAALSEVARTGEYTDLENEPIERSITLTDGSISGAMQLAPVLGSAILNALPVFNVTGQLVPQTPANTKAILGLTDDEIVDAVTRSLGSSVWQGGSTVSAPSKIGSGGWDLDDPGTDGDLTISITTLPANGGSALTAGQYEKNASGTWTAIPGWTAPSGTGNFTISGLTNGTPVDVRLRFNNAIGNGPPSDPQTDTPTNPAYVSNYVDNQGNATIGHALAGGVGPDSKFCTFALHGKVIDPVSTNPSRTFYSSANQRVLFQYDFGTNLIIITFRNTSNTIVGVVRSDVTPDVYHTIAFSMNYTGTPVFKIFVDGVERFNTGSSATGYIINTAFIADSVIDWSSGSGTAGWFLSGMDIHVGEIFLDTTQALDPVLFHGPAGLTNWSTIAPSTRAFFMGNQLTAAQWDAAATNNSGNATGVTNANTFAEV